MHVDGQGFQRQRRDNEARLTYLIGLYFGSRDEYPTGLVYVFQLRTSSFIQDNTDEINTRALDRFIVKSQVI